MGGSHLPQLRPYPVHHTGQCSRLAVAPILLRLSRGKVRQIDICYQPYSGEGSRRAAQSLEKCAIECGMMTVIHPARRSPL